MVEAVLGGDGLAQVAALAVGAPPARPSRSSCRGSRRRWSRAPSRDDETLEELGRYVGEKVRGRTAKVPASVVAEAPIATGEDPVGAVLLLQRRAQAARRRAPSSSTSRRSPR